jgi:hypothetical protein
MKKAVLILVAALSLLSCQKNDPQPISNWAVTFKIIGKGTYHWQTGVSSTGHCGENGEPYEFVASAQKGTLIELDAISDSINVPITVQMTIYPALGNGTYSSTGIGKQKIQFQN